MRQDDSGKTREKRYTVPLFVGDKEELERRAKAQGAPWARYLQMLVHRALKDKEIMR